MGSSRQNDNACHSKAGIGKFGPGGPVSCRT